MPASACVSTSSVTKTLVTPSRLIKASGSLAILQSPFPLVQTNAVIGILRRHVGENHLVADVQPFPHFDGIHRAASQFHGHALRFFFVFVQFEERDLGVGLADHRPSDEHHVSQFLDGDGSVHAQIGAHAVGSTFELDVDVHGCIHRGRIDARDMAGNDAVARIDGSNLPERYVFDLRLGDFQRGFQAIRLRELRQNRAGCDAHADFERRGGGSQLCQHAIIGRAYDQLFHLFLLELVGGLQLFDLNLGCVELRLDGLTADFELLFGKRVASLELGELGLRKLGIDFGLQAELGQLLISVRLQFGLFHVGFDLLGDGLLRELLRLQLDFEVVKVGFGLLDLPFGVGCVEVHLRIAEDHQDLVGVQSGAGEKIDFFDARIEGRGNPDEVFHHQRAEAADLAHHWTALDGVDPDGGALYRRRSRLKPGKPPRDQGDGRHDENDDYNSADQFTASYLFATRDIHGILQSGIRNYSTNIDADEK